MYCLVRFLFHNYIFNHVFSAPLTKTYMSKLAGYGMWGVTSLALVFFYFLHFQHQDNKSKTVGKDWVQFNLKEFGLGLGNQTFRFRTQDLENVPGIDFRVMNK